MAVDQGCRRILNACLRHPGPPAGAARKLLLTMRAPVRGFCVGSMDQLATTPGFRVKRLGGCSHGPTEGGRQEALLCQSYTMKIPINPFPFAGREGESRDSGSSSTTLLAFAVAVPAGQNNAIDALRTSGTGGELDWAEDRSSTACTG